VVEGEGLADVDCKGGAGWCYAEGEFGGGDELVRVRRFTVRVCWKVCLVRNV
jgi:hypothetical protein